MAEFTGQTAIISGGLGDIGQAIARDFATQGADIALGDVLSDRHAEPLLQELLSMGVKARYHSVDVSDAAAVNQWVQEIENVWQPPSLIIPNAATVTVADIRTVTAKQWRHELSVNLDGAFYLAQAAALRLLEYGRPGRIIFIGSWAAEAPHPHMPAYSVSKAALRMLNRCMAIDLAPHGILVNELAPGYVDAGLSGRAFEEAPEIRAQARARVPLQKLITPAEVAREVTYLCQASNIHMTGSTISMDGGLSILL